MFEKPLYVCCIRYVLAVLLLMMAGAGNAKEYFISGQIYDVETDQRLNKGIVTLINLADSTVIDKTVDTQNWHPNNTVNDYFSVHFYAKKGDDLRLRLVIEQPGYKKETKDIQFTKDFPKEMKLGQIYVVKESSPYSVEMMKALDEVTVTATKVKMVVRGDTLVYDASAFRLSEGSMLDALVGQLPGVELKDNGQIMVNGKFVKSLLLDGKDFFKGDPNVALKNLPAYIVKNIKVYDYIDDALKASGERQKKGDNLVLDVRLKKQYQKGFIANVEGGYGSSGRYSARAFAFEYAKNGRIAFYGGINNVNNYSRGPGVYSDNWESAPPVSSGDRRVIKAGTDFMWTAWHGQDDPESFLQFQGWAEYMGTDVDMKSLKSTTDFMSDGSNYTRGGSWSDTRLHRLYTQHLWIYKSADFSKPRMMYVQVNPVLIYEKSNGRGSGVTGKFNVDPEEAVLGEAVDSIDVAPDGPYSRRYGLVYREKTGYDSEQTRLYTSGTSNISLHDYNLTEKLYANIYFDWNYDYRKLDRRDERSVIYTDLTTSGYVLNQYNHNPTKNLMLAPSVRLGWRMTDNAVLLTKYDFLHEYRQGIRDLYLLDSPFSTLDDAMVDVANSYYSRLRTNNNKLTLKLSLDGAVGEKNTYEIWATAKINNYNRKLVYMQAGIDTVMHRGNFNIDPELTMQLRHEGEADHVYSLTFKSEEKLADMARMLDTKDSADPLSVRLGNPALKNERHYNVNASYEMSGNTADQVLNIQGNYLYVSDRVTDMRLYDEATGVSTYRPVNVNGSCAVNGQIDYTTPIGKSNRLYFTTSTRADYIHNPTFVSESSALAASRIAVEDVSLGEQLKLQWSVSKGYSLSFNVGGTWRNATADTPSFSTINAADLKGGMTANIKLPLALNLATDFMVYKRVGYNDDALNTTDCVWNARLERSWMKGRITTRVDAYDILGQLSKITTSINSLGRTETWTNSMRRYVLFTVGFKLDVMPSGKPEIAK